MHPTIRKTFYVCVSSIALGSYGLVEVVRTVKDPGQTDRDSVPVIGARVGTLVSTDTGGWEPTSAITDVVYPILRPNKPNATDKST
jgi:hypothetical protein